MFYELIYCKCRKACNGQLNVRNLISIALLFVNVVDTFNAKIMHSYSENSSYKSIEMVENKTLHQAKL